MIIKSLTSAAGFRAGDASFLQELLHPDKEAVDIGYSLARAVVEPGEKTLPRRGAPRAEVLHLLRIAPTDFRRLRENCVRCHASFVDRVMMTEPGPEVPCTARHRAAGHSE